MLKDSKKTQKDLAEYLDLPLRTLENWITRGIYPVITDGYRIAVFFGVSIEYLLTGKTETNEEKKAVIRSLIKQVDDKLKNL